MRFATPFLLPGTFASAQQPHGTVTRHMYHSTVTCGAKQKYPVHYLPGGGSAHDWRASRPLLAGQLLPELWRQ